MAKILLVDDDKDQNEAISICLSREKYVVEMACTADEAMNLLSISTFDLIILDWNLPDSTGLEILRWFRKRGDTPVIMLTGKGHLNDKTDGLDSGADDYLLKPFLMKELTARVRALLRRPPHFRGAELKAREYTLEAGLYTASAGSSNIRLAPREFAVLEFLARHPKEIFKAEELMSHVWPSDSEATTETLRTVIKNIRQKLNDETIIENIPRVGYKLGT